MSDLADFARRALFITQRYLPPDSGVTQDEAFGELLALIDTHPALIAMSRDPKLMTHIHVAGTTVGKHIDECAVCGQDLRSSIHERA